MSKYDKFFALAKESGIGDAELYIRTSTTLSFNLFHGEIVQFANNSATSVRARGLVNGRFGSATSDVWNGEKCKFLVKQIKENGSIVENDDPAIIFAGSPAYKKVKTYNAALKSVSLEEKIAKAKQLEQKIRSLDPRVIEVQTVAYSDVDEAIVLQNSKGLKLNQKSNFFYIYGVVMVKEGEQVKSNFDLFFGNDWSKLDVDALASKIVKNAVAQLGGEACETGVYKAVLAPNVVASLLSAYAGHAAAENVQKNSSLFIGQLGQKIASPKVSIYEKPIGKTPFARSFDDEGVATYNKAIVEKGVLQTYIYDLSSAAKEGRESTGNGYLRGSSISENFALLSLKPGKMSKEELYAFVGDGVLITDVTGLHAGLNGMSGDFSLQSTGFLIKDGKKDRPLDIITVSGNLMQLFKDVTVVGGDVEIFPEEVECPSLVIKKLNVSGK